MKKKNAESLISRKGRMTVFMNGETHFSPYAVNSGSRYRVLFTTAHGKLKATGSDIICQYQFPKNLAKECIVAALDAESKQMRDFISSLNTYTDWD